MAMRQDTLAAVDMVEPPPPLVRRRTVVSRHSPICVESASLDSAWLEDGSR
jgi:hypothetical protein